MKNDFKKTKNFILKPVAAIIVTMILMLIVLYLPMLYKKIFTDQRFCLGSKERFEFSYTSEYDYEKISDVYVNDIVYISIGINENESTFLSCSFNSENSDDFSIQHVAIGDTIFKKVNSNYYSIFKEGKEYIFIIDKNRVGMDNSEMDL
ncbi:hypothetical protein [Ulvibacterium sp.]|uniref:hypothetical protein n=1 Tax=Ulvibacterium sp. TaxID=2665914 RepID=UPI0026332614|nr:hypothetical protein [Ulvibacterium sp.]